MPRDWDLLALCGMPLVIFAFYGLIKNQSVIRGYMSVGTMLVVVGVLSLGPRVASQTVDEVAILHLKNYFKLDEIRTRNVRKVLIDFYEEQGNSEAAQRERVEREVLSPEAYFARKAKSLMSNGQFRAAIPVFKQLIQANPIHAVSYANIAVCLLRMSEPDSALVWLEASNALSYDSPTTLAYFGKAYRMKGELDLAQYYLLRALKHTDSKGAILLELISLNIDRRDAAQAEGFLERLEEMTQSEPRGFVVLGNMFARAGFEEQAMRCYRDAIERRLDSAATNDLLTRFPQLRE